MMFSLFLTLMQMAHSASFNVTFCARYAVNFVDAHSGVGDDYLTSNADIPARGALVQIQRTSDNVIVWYDYTDWNGSSPGCTTVLLNSAETYQVGVYSRAYVNGNFVNVTDDDSTPAAYAFIKYSNYVPTLPKTETFVTPLGSEWNIAAAAGWGIYRRAAGLSDETFTLYTQACPGTSNNSCISNGALYFGLPASRKYIINHELGHLVSELRNGGVYSLVAYDAPLDDCFTDSKSTHEAVSKEYQSSAAFEGYAHYYAAVSFNQTDQTDCGFAYYKPTDWNLDGNSGDPRDVSCELGPHSDVDPADYFGDFCAATGETNNRGTEWDWLRFLWDLDTDGGVSTTDIFSIYDLANPNSWNATGDGTGGNYPFTRLRNAAYTVGVLTQWDARANYEGINR